MGFASAVPVPRHPVETQDSTDDLLIDGNDGYPEILLTAARAVMRLSGEITSIRLKEALENAADHIQSELLDWHKRRNNEPFSVREKRLYLRAVYFYAKAELMERYKDFDLTANGEKRFESYEAGIDEARRNCRWAVKDLLGEPRSVIEVM